VHACVCAYIFNPHLGWRAVDLCHADALRVEAVSAVGAVLHEDGRRLALVYQLANVVDELHPRAARSAEHLHAASRDL